MENNYRDQADGLRRLFDNAQPKVVAFAAGNAKVGKSVLITNLSYSLTKAGKNVLLLDESADNALSTCFGHQAEYDLEDTVNLKESLADVCVNVMPGIRILPISRLIKRLGSLDTEQQKALTNAFANITPAPDLIMVNTSSDHPLGFSPFGLAADHTIIVMSVSGTSITETYALIKKASLAYSKRKFRVLVNKAKNFDEAAGVFGNLAEVAHGRRIAKLEFAGFIPQDEGIRQASRLCQPVENIFPDSPAAAAFEKLAHQMGNWPLTENNAKGMEHFIQHLLHLGQSIDPIAIYA